VPVPALALVPLRAPNQPSRPSPQPVNPYELPPPAEGSSCSLLSALEALEADHVESGRCNLRLGRGVSGPVPACRASSSGKAKSRILTGAIGAAAWVGAATAEELEALRAACCCCCCSCSCCGGCDWVGVGVVGLAASALWLFAGVREGIEPGRERVEEWRESAADVRREFAGEGGAGREEVSESRDERNELRLGDLELL
jgi:hypothetical protein